MKLVVDASVLVAAFYTTDSHYPPSETFLAAVAEQPVHCPALVLPECAAALARVTGSTSTARHILEKMKQLLRLGLAALTEASADEAVEVAVQCHTRGADSCYIALAAYLEATLITWNQEMLDRGRPVTTTMTPE